MQAAAVRLATGVVRALEGCVIPGVRRRAAASHTGDGDCCGAGNGPVLAGLLAHAARDTMVAWWVPASQPPSQARSLCVSFPLSLSQLTVPKPVATGRDLVVRVKSVSVNPVCLKKRSGSAIGEPRAAGLHPRGAREQRW
jgi:hypothetical protein